MNDAMKTESEFEADVLRLEAENRELLSQLMTTRDQLEYVLAMLRNLCDGVRREQQTRRSEVMTDELGDGVSVTWDGFTVVLRTEREDRANEIHLEPIAIARLVDFVERCKKKAPPAKLQVLW
jgi:hypothetical protein